MKSFISSEDAARQAVKNQRKSAHDAALSGASAEDKAGYTDDEWYSMNMPEHQFAGEAGTLLKATPVPV